MNEARSVPWSLRRKAGAIVIAVLAALIVLAAVLMLKPVGVADPIGTRDPATTYEAAMARFAEVEAREASGPPLLAECHSRIQAPPGTSARAPRVIVLIHGYSTCPQQYHLMADLLVGRGFTVYLPRMPQHGEAERVHTTLDKLTPEQLISFANETADIATGLGDDVAVLGLSGGGAVAAYLGQFRDDVGSVVTVAPFLGIPAVPGPLTPGLINALMMLPPIGIGDTPTSQTIVEEYAPYSSYDNDTRAAAAFMTLGQVVLADAAARPPQAGTGTVVINDADDIINNGLVETLLARWTASAPDRTTSYHFPADLKLPHDVIGPDRQNEVVEISYPVLFRLLGVT